MTSAGPGRRRRRSLRECESGAELIEFALIFPTLLLVVLGIIDFGFLFQRYEVLTNAAREGARLAILPDYQMSGAVIQTRVTQYLTSGGLTGPSTVTIGAPQAVTIGSACIAVRPVTVAYNHTFLFVGPLVTFFGGSGFTTRTLTATSSMRTEIAAGVCP
jgi:Flp pilus assembly protein TadG